MTIRDIVVAFGFEVDRNSERQAESRIQGLKNLAGKLLGAIGIGLSISGIAGLAEAAADVEALKSQFSQVFGEMESDAQKKLDAIAEETGVNANRMKASFTQIASFAKVSGVEQAQALELSDRAMKAVADSSAFYDRSIENVTESLQSFLKGNFENDAALGLSCTETTRNAAANALYSKSFQDLSEAEKQFTLLQMVEDANKASGALGQAARESDTWTNQLGNLKQGLHDLKAASGQGLLQPAVKALKILVSLTQGATKAVTNLTGENGFLTRSFDRTHALVKKLQPAIDRMMQTLSRGAERGIGFVCGLVDRLGGVENILKILAVVAAAFFAVMTYAKALTAVKALVAAWKSMDKAMMLAKLKVLAIVAVVAVLFLVIEDFVNFLMGNDSVIGTLFDKAGIGADNARQKILEAWTNVKEFLLNVWDFIKQAAGMFIDTVKGFFERHGESIRQNFERAWGIIKTFLQGVWTFISQLASTLFGSTEDSIDGSTQNTKDKLLAVWGAILEALSAIWDALYEVGSTVFNAIATVIETVFGWIQMFWNTWGSTILAWFKGLWDNLGQFIGGFLDVIKGLANFISSVFTGDWAGAWEAIKEVFSGIWDMITALLQQAWNTISTVLTVGLGLLQSLWQTVWGAISSFFGGILGTLLDAATSIFGNILSAVTEKVGSIRDAVVNGFNAAVDFIKGLPGQALTWGADIIDGIVKGITGAVGKVADAVSGVASKIKSFLHFSVPDEGPLTDYESWMPDFMGGLAKGIRDNKGLVLEGIMSLAGGMSKGIHGIMDLVPGRADGSAEGASMDVPPAAAGSGITGGTADDVIDGFNTAKDFIRDMSGEALKWGADIMDGLADGITGSIGKAADAVSKAKDILQLSASDGELSAGLEDWMPDFMGGLAKGIRDSTRFVLDGIKKLAVDIPKGAGDNGNTASDRVKDFVGDIAKGILDNKDILLDGARSLAGDISLLIKSVAVSPRTASAGTVNNSTSRSVTQNVNISNSYTGGNRDDARHVSRVMKKSASDATAEMARALEYTRG